MGKRYVITLRDDTRLTVDEETRRGIVSLLGSPEKMKQFIDINETTFRLDFIKKIELEISSILKDAVNYDNPPS